MRPIFPSLAALAWNEPRRRAYWETELINALRIVDRGWSTPEEMRDRGRRDGHTQWMPEVWLNVGIDYDHDGRVSPFGKPTMRSFTARYLVNRGKYHRGEHWATKSARPALPPAAAEVTRHGRAPASPARRPTIPATQCVGADMGAVPAGRASCSAQFLFGAQLQPFHELCAGDLPSRRPHSRRTAFIQPFPGSERALTLAEVQEMQVRLTKAGFDTGGTDGRVGNDTMQR